MVDTRFATYQSTAPLNAAVIGTVRLSSTDHQHLFRRDWHSDARPIAHDCRVHFVIQWRNEFLSCYDCIVAKLLYW